MRFPFREEHACFNRVLRQAIHAHAFLRDEGYRYDPSLAHLCYGWVFDLLHRRLALASNRSPEP
jgi:hypothetical protein